MQTKWGGGGAWYIHTWCISPMRDEASVQPLPAWLCSKLGLTKLAPPDDDGLRLRVRVRVRVRIRVRARARVRARVRVRVRARARARARVRVRMGVRVRVPGRRGRLPPDAARCLLALTQARPISALGERGPCLYERRVLRGLQIAPHLIGVGVRVWVRVRGRGRVNVRGRGRAQPYVHVILPRLLGEWC